jgi:hypothetical protein
MNEIPSIMGNEELFNLSDRPEGIFKQFLREIGLYFVDFSRKNFAKPIGKVSLWN